MEQNHEWLDENFLRDVASNYLSLSPDEFVINGSKVEYALKPGNNYNAGMYRVKLKINITKKKSFIVFSFIVKLKEMTFAGELTNQLRMFPKEIEIYEKILPGLEAIWQDDSVIFGPKCFKTVSTPTQLLALEDLSVKKFEMLKRVEGLSLEQSKKVVQKLAKFHATSVIYHEKNGPFGDDFKTGMFSEITDKEFSDYYRLLFDEYLKTIKSWKGCEKYVEKISLWEGKVYTGAYKALEYNPDGFNVLNHGDPWLNNLMFSKDDVILVDFQLPFWGSPAYDLYYFIILSCAEHVRVQNFDELIQCYHHTLESSLRHFSYTSKIPTLDDIQDDLLKRGFFAAALTVESLPTVVMDSSIEFDMDLMMEPTEEGVAFRRKMYNNPIFVSAMQKLLPFLHVRRFLDLPEH